jgi:hypothetical protein
MHVLTGARDASSGEGEGDYFWRLVHREESWAGQRINVFGPGLVLVSFTRLRLRSSLSVNLM